MIELPINPYSNLTEDPKDVIFVNPECVALVTPETSITCHVRMAHSMIEFNIRMPARDVIKLMEEQK